MCWRSTGRTTTVSVCTLYTRSGYLYINGVRGRADRRHDVKRAHVRQNGAAVAATEWDFFFSEVDFFTGTFLNADSSWPRVLWHAFTDGPWYRWGGGVRILEKNYQRTKTLVKRKEQNWFYLQKHNNLTRAIISTPLPIRCNILYLRSIRVVIIHDHIIDSPL